MYAKVQGLVKPTDLERVLAGAEEGWEWAEGHVGHDGKGGKSS